MINNHIFSEQLAEEFRAAGKKAYAEKRYEEAIKQFTEALKHAASDHVLYSNRSAAYYCLGRYQEALDDANQCIIINKTWAKGFGRRGDALYAMNRMLEAKESFEAVLELEPHNDRAKNLVEAADFLHSNKSKKYGDLIAKVGKDHELCHLLSDVETMNKLVVIQNDPRKISEYLGDTQLMSVVFALMRKSENGGDAAANTEKSENTNELDASALFVGENGQGSNERDKVSEDRQQGDQGDSSSSNARSTREDSTDRTESGVNNGYCKQDMFDQMYVGEDVKKEAEKRAKVERAEAKKEVGNGFYGSRQYHKAAEYYAEAAKLVPTNMTYLNNLAATHLELKNYQKCVEVCQRAIDVGRENKATFKEIAKAYFRMGLAKDSMGSYKEAAAYYSKSLVEYRSTACEERLEQVEKKIKASDAFAKLDESNHILDQGLELKNNENYLAAIDCFTQSIALDPENHEAYYFRAMCRQAIDQFDAALEDIEAAISISAEQPRYYYIKASILCALKRPAECLKMCDVATQLATDVKHSHSLLTDIEKLRVCCSS